MMKKTNYVCPVCGCDLYWNDSTSGEVTDPKVDEIVASVRESYELRCMACWADVDIPISLFDEVMVIG